MTKEEKFYKARKYRKDNKEYFAKKAKLFYHKNKIKINETRRKNPYSLMSILKRNAQKRKIEFTLDKDSFTEWWNSQEQKCVYCEIPIERMAVIDKSKKLSKRLSIDRADNDIGYTIKNIVLACMRCNFIKSNLFSFKEMKEIGIKYIKPKWQL